MNYGYQVHGYKNGHQCLFSNVGLSRSDQDTIDRLSDISGSLKPGELFAPYLTCYPLPSKSFFVLARTWQDLDAPRGGCVITKSLLLPMDSWLQNQNPATIISTNLQITPNKYEFTDEVINDEFFHPFSLPPVEKTPVNELVEAVFLEKRQPIVYYNALEAEAIVYRLYAVFWSNLKSTFSICTFSLSQRTLDGKPFDLLFAPTSAKPRFNEWPGRRIDGFATQPRHRWTTLLVNSIFKTNTPYLLGQSDNLPKDSSDIEFDENNLRLNLLWLELLETAKSPSPYLSVLGILDILNSLDEKAPILRSIAFPLIRSSLISAPERLEETDAWGFISSILLRYKRKLMDREMFELIQVICTQLAKKNPQATVDFLSNYKRPVESIPSLLFTGVGNGIYQYFDEKNGTDGITVAELSQTIVTRLTAFSELFAELVILKTNFDYLDWDVLLDKINQAPVDATKVRAERNLSLAVNENTRFITVKSLLGCTDHRGFQIVAKNILKKVNFKIEKFNEIILEEAKRLQEQYYIFDILTKYDRHGYRDDLLIGLIALDPSLLRELCFNYYVSKSRKAKIISYLFENPSEKLRYVIEEDESLSYELLNLTDENTFSKKSLSNILLCGRFPVALVVKKLNEIGERSLEKFDRKYIDNFSSRLLNTQPFKFNNETAAFFRKIEPFDFTTLFEKVTKKNLPSTEVVNNINLLFTINNKFNRFLVENVNVVSRLLAENLSDRTINNDIASRWIAFLKESEMYKKAHKEAAVAMLDFSFRCNNFDPTQLIAASFPVVYKSFLKGKPITNFIPTIFFSDWDKCKTLREDLVKLYMSKPWSRFGLIYVAGVTNILKEVIKILIDKKSGKRFLEDAIDDAKKIPERAALLNKIFEEL